MIRSFLTFFDEKVSPKWIEFSPAALEWDPPPSILAEMYSFVIASALYNIRHEYLLSMLSHPDSNEFMQNTFDIDLEGRLKGEEPRFHIFHYCHGFWLGEKRNKGTIRNGGWNFHKGHVPVDYLYNCDIPLLTQLRGEEGNDVEMLEMFKKRDQSKIEGQYGMVWVLDVLISSINKAVLNYRMKY